MSMFGLLTQAVAAERDALDELEREREGTGHGISSSDRNHVTVAEYVRRGLVENTDEGFELLRLMRDARAGSPKIIWVRAEQGAHDARWRERG